MKLQLLSVFFFSVLLISGCFKPVDQKAGLNSDSSNQNVNAAKTYETANTAKTETTNKSSIELKTNPPIIEANKQIELTFIIKDENGTPLKDFKIVHEKKMHLIAVSSDLAEFEHLHPDLQADGSFKIKHIFKHGGKFILFPDATPDNGLQTVERFEIEVKGAEAPAEKLLVDSNLTKQIDGISVTMKPKSELTSDQESSINFVVSDQSTGKPVTDLQNYLGALAHIVIISEDSKDFLHVHPISNKNADETSVLAHTNFPRGGIYKIWVQFQRNNKVTTLSYVVNVTKGAGKTTTAVKTDNGIIKIKVNGDGYTPATISVKKGEAAKLVFLREDENNCGDEVVFSTLNIKKQLPVGKEVVVEINPTETGEINFSCGMNMLKGKILVQ